ncbi:MAG: ABC transporter permease [Alphaproteobacteria bacterium]|nr:ABC transporter permease [Alphaproteobacteria bacterium]
MQLSINNNQAVLLFNNDPKEAADEEILRRLKEAKVKTVFAETEATDISEVLEARIYTWSKKIQNAGISFNFERLPKNMRALILLSLSPANTPPKQTQSSGGFLALIGEKGYDLWGRIKNALGFMKETLFSLGRFFSGRAIFRKKDFWFIFADCGYKAVGIIALVSFLVGLILAFVGALQLKTFGAGIFVASMVSIGMTRIMAAIMAGIIIAGRTGSSYAATLGTMQVNEELDALKTLGVKITDYLVAPRLVALILVIPFLTLLADALGILGGAVVGVLFLDISSSSYFDYAIRALSLRNILVGLLHSLIYGVIISICGCYAGVNAGRDADAVGKATTGAVVTALVWMIVATGILTVILEVLNI